MSNQTQELPRELQDALNKGLLKRLPITFLPVTRQQLHDWEYLFPYERKSILRLLLHVAKLSPDESAALFRKIVQLEEKMGVRSWQFSTDQQTIQNASLLARSPYFREWRSAVQRVFDAADRDAETEKAGAPAGNRCVLLILPRCLPLEGAKVWQRWQGIGRPVRLDMSLSRESSGAAEMLFSKDETRDGRTLLSRSGPNTTLADRWILDAGQGLVDCVLRWNTAENNTPSAVLLSHKRLELCRQKFSHELNTMRKDLADADAVFDRLRKTEISPWCPPEVSSEPVVREFVRSVYLSGNGALLFGNSFVEWGASEALRRARPPFLAAQFGVRSRPKPFTSVAVFENQDEINPLPAVDDLPGSALDAQVLALYVWLAASRYDEYQHNTVCLCLAESLSEAYVIAPSEFPLWREPEPIRLERLRAVLADWAA